MENMESFITKTFYERASDVLNEIATSDETCKQVSTEIIKMETGFNEYLAEEARQLIGKYKELFLDREAVVIDLIYRQGFKDGATFQKICQNSIG